MSVLVCQELDRECGHFPSGWCKNCPKRQPKNRRVVCAAIRAADGAVLLGIRHYSQDMHRQIEARHDGHKFMHRHDPDQGFVDQHGVYMTREEAFQVAWQAGQVLYPGMCGEGLEGPKLYTEGLY